MGNPNILLVVLDSVRASNCSLHGHANETTPFLNEFGSDRATVYDQARAPGARSVTSHASLFSGLHVAEHGVVSAAERLDPTVSVFHKLRDEGYNTGIFTENDWLTAVDVGLKDGFDHVVGARNVPFPESLNPHEFVSSEGEGNYVKFVKTALSSNRPVRSLANGVATKLQSDYMRYLPGKVKASTPANVYVDAFLEWSGKSDGPWAACVNLMDAHIPYEPAAEYDLWGGSEAMALQSAFKDQKWTFHGGQNPWWQKKAVESLYDGTIKQMDSELERLIATLESRGTLNDTLLVVTSDHGEGFGEPSRLQDSVRIAEHGVSIHDAVVHVPLLVKLPGQTESHRVDRPATLTAFPDVVNSVRDGRRPSAGFCPDEPVVSTAVGLDEPLQRRASDYVQDISPWLDDKQAVFDYDESAGIVVKTCRTQDTAATIHSRDPQTAYRVHRTDDERVDAVFGGLTELDVRTDGESLEDLDNDTYGRLEDLGYV